MSDYCCVVMSSVTHIYTQNYDSEVLMHIITFQHVIKSAHLISFGWKRRCCIYI